MMTPMLGAGASAAACSVLTPGDILNENFTGCAAGCGSGCDVTWTGVSATAPTCNAAEPAGLTNGCTTAMYIACDASSDIPMFVYKTITSTDNFYVKFSVYINRNTSSNFKQIDVFHSGGSTTAGNSETIQAYILRWDTNRLYIVGTTSDYFDLAQGQWYDVTINVVKNGTSSMWVAGLNSDNPKTATAGDYSVTNVFFGAGVRCQPEATAYQIYLDKAFVKATAF
jgi:hypothetical protein